MHTITKLMIFSAAAVFGLAAAALSAQDKYSLQVTNGLTFAEFRGYEDWQVVAVSHGTRLAVILGNSVALEAFRSGIPGNGKPFPDGAKLAKIHWNASKKAAVPGQPFMPDTLHDADFMVKDLARFADSGGWGYAEFEYDTASSAFRPGTIEDAPPQGNDAKCGAACHTVAKTRDYVFTRYGQR
jgi:hypothetical protein